MSTKGGGHLPLKDEDFNKHEGTIEGKLNAVSWEPATGAMDSLEDDKKSSAGQWRSSSASTLGSKDTVKVIDATKEIAGTNRIMHPDVAVVLDVIKKGFKIGLRVFELYCQSSGLDQLMSQNSQRRLPENQKGAGQSTQDDENGNQ